jgi:Leucine rich repeat
LLFVTVSMSVAEGRKVSCEKIIVPINEGMLKTCLLENSTEITRGGFKISASRDESMQQISFRTNRNIQYLPEMVSKSFPDLIVYDAGSCQLNRISEKNFHGLHVLQKLFLDNNKIKQVSSNTFAELSELLIIDLSEWKF